MCPQLGLVNLSAQESDIDMHSLKTKEGNIILTSHACVFLLMPILITLAHLEISYVSVQKYCNLCIFLKKILN